MQASIASSPVTRLDRKEEEEEEEEPAMACQHVAPLLAVGATRTGPQSCPKDEMQIVFLLLRWVASGRNEPRPFFLRRGPVAEKIMTPSVTPAKRMTTSPSSLTKTLDSPHVRAVLKRFMSNTRFTPPWWMITEVIDRAVLDQDGTWHEWHMWELAGEGGRFLQKAMLGAMDELVCLCRGDRILVELLEPLKTKYMAMTYGFDPEDRSKGEEMEELRSIMHQYYTRNEPPRLS